MDAFSALADLLILIGTLLGVKKMLSMSRRDTPRARLGLRIGRIGTWAVGGVIVVVSLVLAIRKIDHFRNALYTQGTITGVQHSSHSFAPYSFYVEFQALGRRRHEFAFTYLVFPKKERQGYPAVRSEGPRKDRDCRLRCRMAPLFLNFRRGRVGHFVFRLDVRMAQLVPRCQRVGPVPKSDPADAFTRNNNFHPAILFAPRRGGARRDARLTEPRCHNKARRHAVNYKRVTHVTRAPVRNSLLLGVAAVILGITLDMNTQSPFAPGSHPAPAAFHARGVLRPAV